MLKWNKGHGDYYSDNGRWRIYRGSRMWCLVNVSTAQSVAYGDTLAEAKMWAEKTQHCEVLAEAVRP